MTGSLAIVFLSALAVGSLERDFREPPREARSHTWYHLMNGNVTKEGITCDFEAIAKAGLGGVQMFDAGCAIPAGEVRFNSPEWFGLLAHAEREAQRLGLEICIPNCSGWSSSGGPWNPPSNAMKRVVHTITRVTGPTNFCGRLPRTAKDNGYYADIAVLAVPDRPSAPIADLAAKSFAVRGSLKAASAPADATGVGTNEVVDLTARLGADGALAWTVPSGAWKLLRFGAVCNGMRNHPASQFGVGLEVDKLSAEAMDHHFDRYVGRLCDRLGKGPRGNGLGITGILVDSYEVGSQNWTPKMESEFLRRRGYSLRPYLPAFAGITVGSSAETDRFFEDFRRTVADLFAENYAGALQRKCRACGLTLSLEPYGSCPADNLQYGRYCDIPMGEFWAWGDKPNYNLWCGTGRLAAHLAHVWGRKYCATESFTCAPPDAGRWLVTPAAIKAQADHAYAEGVNRLIYHRFTHQPWPGTQYVPGMTMGRWGMHLDRTQTWWPFARPWFDYQARCQALLQRGSPRADILVFCGEQAPNQGGYSDSGYANLFKCPAGYAHDICAADAVAALAVDEDGRLVSPGGVRYALLYLPDLEAMTPTLLERLLALAEKGAHLAGRTRPVRAPGLSFGAAGDARVRALAERLWTHPNFCAGRADAAVKKLNLPAQVRAESKVPADYRFSWIHRAEPGADWYFTCVNNPEETEVEVSFGETGRVPELWDAETGAVADAATWRMENGRTFVTVPYTVHGSKFVVFRRPTRDLSSSNFPLSSFNFQLLSSDWTVEFPHGFAPNGTPEAAGAPERIVFPELTDWTSNAVEGVRYFSGTVVYRKEVDLKVPAGAKVVMDLGQVLHFAEVTVNGKTFAPLWKRPYRVDITSALKPDGKAKIEIKVANLWPNRLIGDERTKASDCEWQANEFGRFTEYGIREIPDWVRRGERSPTGRFTFTTWRHWTKDDALLPSGLIGPVRVGILTATRPGDRVYGGN